jgi:hypothetical protein
MVGIQYKLQHSSTQDPGSAEGGGLAGGQWLTMESGGGQVGIK